MASISVIDNKNEKVLIGYAFFVIVLRPIFDLSEKILYYEIIQKVKVVKILEVKVKALLSKSRELNIPSNDLLNLFKVLSIVPFIFLPIQRIYLKMGLKVYEIEVLVFFRFGFFSYNLMLNYCPLFLVVYEKLVSHRFIQKIYKKLKLFFEGNYEFDDEKLLVIRLANGFSAILTFIILTILGPCVFYTVTYLGGKYVVILTDFRDLLNSIFSSKNLFEAIKNFFSVLKKQIFTRIENERALWQLTTNNFSRECRIASWLVYIVFVIRYAKYFKDLTLKTAIC